MNALDFVLGGIVARLLRWLALSGVHPNFNKVTSNAWIGGANHTSFIISEGFDTVIDLRETTDAGYRTRLEQSGISYVNIGIPDGKRVPPQILMRVVEELLTRTKRAEKVLLHCNLGRGRAPLSMAAYLVHEGATTTEAVKAVKERRNVTHMNSSQRQALEDYSSYCLHQRAPRG